MSRIPECLQENLSDTYKEARRRHTWSTGSVPGGGRRGALRDGVGSRLSLRGSCKGRTLHSPGPTSHCTHSHVWKLAAASATPAAHCTNAIQAARANTMYGVNAVPNVGRTAGGAARCAFHGAWRHACWRIVCSIQMNEHNQLNSLLGHAHGCSLERCTNRAPWFALIAGANCDSNAACAGRPHPQSEAQVQRQEVLGLLILSWCHYLQSTHQPRAGHLHGCFVPCRFCFSFERTNLHMSVRRKGNGNATNFAELFQSRKGKGECRTLAAKPPSA
jgi:hypothetical protein